MSLFSIFDLGNYLTSFCYIRYFGFALQSCANFHSVRKSTYLTKDFKSFTFFRPQNELFVMILRAYMTNNTHIHTYIYTCTYPQPQSFMCSCIPKIFCRGKLQKSMASVVNVAEVLTRTHSCERYYKKSYET